MVVKPDPFGGPAGTYYRGILKRCGSFRGGPE